MPRSPTRETSHDPERGLGGRAAVRPARAARGPFDRGPPGVTARLGARLTVRPARGVRRALGPAVPAGPAGGRAPTASAVERLARRRPVPVVPVPPVGPAGGPAGAAAPAGERSRRAGRPRWAGWAGWARWDAARTGRPRVGTARHDPPGCRAAGAEQHGGQG